MQVRIDQARRDGAAGEANQMRARADQRLELAIRPERDDLPPATAIESLAG